MLSNPLIPGRFARRRNAVAPPAVNLIDGMRCLGLILVLAVPALHAATPAPTPFDEAFENLYNFNFPGAHQVLDRYQAEHPQDPMVYAIRSSAYLFVELDRLGILESEFLIDDKKIAKKEKVQPDPATRVKFMQAIDETHRYANAALARDPNDRNALFALAISEGLATDYMAFVDKHQFSSLTPAKQSNTYAQRLLKLDPTYYDAYLTAGLSEYLVGSLPFFVKWFVHFDNVNGDKQTGVRNLQLVARDGHYLKPFAKILLGIIALREKRPQDARRLLADLSTTYPQNHLFRSELLRLDATLPGMSAR